MEEGKKPILWRTHKKCGEQRHLYCFCLYYV